MHEVAFKMWYLLYNMALVIGAPFIVVALFLKKRCRRGFTQRVGLALPKVGDPKAEVLWVHAVSMGEVLAIISFVSAIHKAYPELKIIISTVTETGRESVENRLMGIAQHCYLPLDWPWTVRRFIKHVRPKFFIVIETELWPNLLKELHANGVSAALVNGRLSTRSFYRYLHVKSFMKEVLGCFNLCLVQSDRDAQRMIELGANPEHVHRTGNMKFDIELAVLDGQSKPVTFELLGLHPYEALVVAGSTHSKEEGVLLSSYKEILSIHANVVLLIAPRHIERSDEVVETIKSFGFEAVRRSTIEDNGKRLLSKNGKARVILLDTRGELASVYALAKVTFVGGTFVPVGGHNLLEPASWGKPVLFGPFTDHCQEIANLLLESKGGKKVRDASEMASLIVSILDDEDLACRMGRSARQVVLENQGVVKRNVELLQLLLQSQS